MMNIIMIRLENTLDEDKTFWTTSSAPQRREWVEVGNSLVHGIKLRTREPAWWLILHCWISLPRYRPLSLRLFLVFRPHTV